MPRVAANLAYLFTERPLIERFAAALEVLGATVATGRFAAHMHVELVNDGPVTLLLDSKKQF